MLRYPVELTKDTNGTYLVTFPDIPEAASVGDDIESALIEAEQGLSVALEFYFDDKRPIPMPSQAKPEQHTVPLSTLRSLKVHLLNEMLKQGVKKAEMARRLDVYMPQVDRLLDFRYPSKIDFVEKAFSKLGRELQLSII